MQGVENTEYYTLPDNTSSDYNSDQSAEFSYDSSPSANQSLDLTILNRRHNYSNTVTTTPHRRKAIVLCEYRRKSISEVPD